MYQTTAGPQDGKTKAPKFQKQQDRWTVGPKDRRPRPRSPRPKHPSPKDKKISQDQNITASTSGFCEDLFNPELNK